MTKEQLNPAFQVRLAEKESSGRDWRIWPPSVRWQVPQLHQPSKMKHGDKTVLTLPYSVIIIIFNNYFYTPGSIDSDG